MIIELNEAEQRLAKYVAQKRNKAARSLGIEDQKIGPQGSVDIDLDGMGAEIAFCKMTNTFPDLATGHTPDADVYTTAMGSIDVKTTRHKNGRLLARREKVTHAPDAYALMICEFPKYVFAGWTTAPELLQECNLVDLGHGEGYGLTQSDLKKDIPL